jgi:hypothetical protein
VRSYPAILATTDSSWAPRRYQGFFTPNEIQAHFPPIVAFLVVFADLDFAAVVCERVVCVVCAGLDFAVVWAVLAAGFLAALAFFTAPGTLGEERGEPAHLARPVILEPGRGTHRVRVKSARVLERLGVPVGHQVTPVLGGVPDSRESIHLLAGLSRGHYFSHLTTLSVVVRSD